MAENDDKLKDLKSRLGLVSGPSARPVATDKAEGEGSAAKLAHAETQEGTVVAPSSVPAPTRQMTAEEMGEREAELSVDVSAVSTGKRGPLLVICTAIALIAFGTGHFIGGNLADRSMFERIEEDTSNLKTALERKNSETGDSSLDRIKAQVAVTETLAKKLESAGAADIDAVEKMVLEFLPKCAAFETKMDFNSQLSEGFTAYKLLPELMTLSLNTSRYQDRVSALGKRAELLATMKGTRDERYEDPNFGRKKLYVQVGTAKISSPGEEDKEVPMAWGEWVKGDPKGFAEMPVVDAPRGAPKTEWKVNVNLMNEKAPQLVPSAQIADVNLRPFLEPLDRGAYREVLGQTIKDILALDALGKTLALDRLSAAVTEASK